MRIICMKIFFLQCNQILFNIRFLQDFVFNFYSEFIKNLLESTGAHYIYTCILFNKNYFYKFKKKCQNV